MTILAHHIAAPYQHLLQRNTELMLQYWTSPAVLNEMRSAGTDIARDVQASMLKLMQSPSFSTLGRELFGSYSRFLSELMQSQVESAAAAQREVVERGAAALRKAA